MHVTDLRSIAVQGLVAPDHLPPIAEAKAVLHWHARHRFCPNCGAATRLVMRRLEARLPAMQGRAFSAHRSGRDHAGESMASAACSAAVPRFVPTMWSCLAGFVEPGESIEDAVQRETREEAGITCGRVIYFASQPWPFPTSLMIGCHAEALTHEIVVDREELEDARWFSKDEIEAMLMRKHPQGLTTPPPVAIAHHIIRAWVEDEIALTERVHQKAKDPVRRHRGAGHRHARAELSGARHQGVGAANSSSPAAAAPPMRRSRSRGSAVAWLSPARSAAATMPSATAFSPISTAEGIDCSGVARVAGGTASVSLILLDATGEKTIATRRGVKLGDTLPNDPAELVADADAVLVDNRFPEFVTAVCRAAQARKIPIVIDLDQATNSWTIRCSRSART